LEAAERRRVRGYLINKFRGDPSLLGSGLSFLEERTGVPVLGVLPFVFGLPVDEEDAVAFETGGARPEPAPAGPAEIDIAVVRLPHISNATDFHPLERAPGVGVRYVDLPPNFGEPDLVI